MKYDYEKVREMSDAKQKQAMKNKVGDSSPKSKSSATATNKTPGTKSISTPATRKAKQKKDMRNIVGPGAVDKSSPTQKQKAAKKKTTAPNKTTAPKPEKESSWLSSLFGGDSSEKDEKRWKSSKSPRARRSIARGATNAGYAKGGVVKPRGWGKARIPGK